MRMQSTIAEFVAFQTVINETIGQADRQSFLDRRFTVSVQIALGSTDGSAGFRCDTP
jgi:hypothetical protein